MAGSQTFQGIDPAKWEHFRELVLSKVGIGINSLVGNGSAKGITLSWSYSPDLQMLTTLVKRSKEDIGTDIAALVKAAYEARWTH